MEELRAAAEVATLDLVILDFDLTPNESGTPYQELKRDPAFSHVPVILLTDPSPLVPNPAESLSQPDRTLHKHFSPFELLNLVYGITGY